MLKAVGQPSPRLLFLSPKESEVLSALAHRATSDSEAGLNSGLVKDEMVVLAQRIHHRRRERGRHFGSDLFGEPAWDMLLAAYWLPSTGVELTVLELCKEAEASKTTAWRSLDRLVQMGILETRACSKDRRSTKVSLTSLGVEKIESYLRSVGATDAGLTFLE